MSEYQGQELLRKSLILSLKALSAIGTLISSFAKTPKRDSNSLAGERERGEAGDEGGQDRTTGPNRIERERLDVLRPVNREGAYQGEVKCMRRYYKSTSDFLLMTHSTVC